MVALKGVPRQGWIERAQIASPESVADHTFSTSVLVMLFGDIIKLDTCKLIRMSLLHDLAESVTGDITPDQMPRKEKIALERDAMRGILSSLPAEIRHEYMRLWEEFVDDTSDESRLLHEIDKLDMALQASEYCKRYEEKSLAVFLNDASRSIQDPVLKGVLRSITNAKG